MPEANLSLPTPRFAVGDFLRLGGYFLRVEDWFCQGRWHLSATGETSVETTYRVYRLSAQPGSVDESGALIRPGTALDLEMTMIDTHALPAKAPATPVTIDEAGNILERHNAWIARGDDPDVLEPEDSET